ncbi:MAG: hypothetical protein MK086_08380 [Flavobacteriales bacterium]|nr:hypothetical protein [Flavobacteriales bacterium]
MIEKVCIQAKNIVFPLLSLAILLVGFGCSDTKPKYEKPLIDLLIQQYRPYEDFSIILYDMDYDEGSKNYRHQYQVLYTSISSTDTLINDSITGWYNVDEMYFNKHIDNMGMEIAFKKDGKIEKKAAPPGYGNYVGNERYGRWQTDGSGRSFWVFYGQYRLLSDLFRMGRYPYYRSSYNEYYSGYYSTGRPYYGSASGGGYRYGTNSEYTKSSRPNSKWNERPTSFKRDVRNRVKRSSQRTRSNSRYKGSSSRSRSGRAGK